MKMKVTSILDKEPMVNNKLYLGEGDFDTVYALCMERDTIGLTCSSTPTGKRSKFYQVCTDKSLYFTRLPSGHNIIQMWSDAMEEEFRNTYDQKCVCARSTSRVRCRRSRCIR